MLCYFLLYNTVTQLYVYIHSFSLGHSSHPPPSHLSSEPPSYIWESSLHSEFFSATLEARVSSYPSVKLKSLQMVIAAMKLKDA